MVRHDNALQGVMLVALLILFPMTIQLLVHQDESPLWKTVYVEVESEEDEDPEARSESRTREDVARIATFNIKVFGETKMGKSDVVSELVNITLRYDMVVVQEIKDLDQTVPYDFLDAINNGSNESYAMALSERSGQQEDDQGGQEQYAIYYRTSRFELDSAWLHNDSELDEFQREPFISNFNLLSKNGTVIEDLTFITVHTKPAYAVNETASLHNVVETLKENSTESDIILLGDFNADCSYASTYELNQLEIRSPEYLWVVPDSADTTFSENTHCAYDRIVLTSDVDDRFFGRWGVDRDMSDSDVSDHFPVWFDLDIAEDVLE
ncbi:MAG: endonuclease/exonuclease/phosphatase family protein [Candidatus Poseidoniaceae archaeon]